MKDIKTYDRLEEFGRMRLSPSFFMRDFLHSEIAAWHQLRNVPDNPDAAIAMGKELCSQLLEPLQLNFGRIHVRSGYRSPSVNDFGNKNHLNCASNASNHAAHIWDYPDSQGFHGATACIVMPWLVDHIEQGGCWTDMAWWIHDHLPYSSLYFFPRLAAFNIGWHQNPVRRIDSYAHPRGCLTRPGMANHEGRHADQYVGFPALGRCSAAVTLRSQPLLPESRVVRSTACSKPAVSVVVVNPGFSVQANELPPVKAIGKLQSGGVINYRAVHSKTIWRKVKTHSSLDAAINGRDGAAGLFARRVRIDYEKHGDPLYVLVWQEGAESGYLIRPDKASSGGICQVPVAMDLLMKYERAGQVDKAVLERLF